jgi:uncharacterized protein (TIGR02996 family)
MNTLDALLAGIVAEPREETRWLVLADWLDENEHPRRGELLRLHRGLLATCCEPNAHPERSEWQRRIVELLGAGVMPCGPRYTLTLTGGMPLVSAFVPPAVFLMGGTLYDHERPVHRRTLAAGFFLGLYPVTQLQWKAVMGTEPSRFNGANRPVEQVSWDDCHEFCAALTEILNGTGTVRLPTEAEWECACRAGTTTHYHFGDVPDLRLANYNGNNWLYGSSQEQAPRETADAGSFPPNPWGLYDMHGNVAEWCADRYLPYSVDEQPHTNKEPTDNSRVARGGSWYYNPQLCRAAARGAYAATSRNSGIGFRVCFRLE